MRLWSSSSSKITFAAPLTLIHGAGGCGKTSIIECIKYALTGELPPLCKEGQYFVMNPDVLNVEKSCGEVKLTVLNETRDIAYTISRSAEVKKTGANQSNLKFRTQKPAITHNGVKETKSSDEATENMCTVMGIPKAIIDNVLLCSQFEAGWPLGTDLEVTTIFDKIFGIAKFKGLEEIRQTRVKMEDLKDDISELAQRFENIDIKSPDEYNKENNSDEPEQNEASNNTMEDISTDEHSDFFIEITVGDPQRIGEDMGSYLAYKVSTHTSIPKFKSKQFSTMRRFRDFLGLRDLLVSKYPHLGRIIPPAPERNLFGTTMSTQTLTEAPNGAGMEWIENRRAALERFVSRIAQHPVLCLDPEFINFLQSNEDLPRAVNTAALSGAGVMRFFNRFGETVNKITYKMDENDPTFEKKTSVGEDAQKDIEGEKYYMNLEDEITDFFNDPQNFPKLKVLNRKSTVEMIRLLNKQDVDGAKKIIEVQKALEFLEEKKSGLDKLAIKGALEEFQEKHYEVFNGALAFGQARDNKTASSVHNDQGEKENYRDVSASKSESD